MNKQQKIIILFVLVVIIIILSFFTFKNASFKCPRTEYYENSVSTVSVSDDHIQSAANSVTQDANTNMPESTNDRKPMAIQSKHYGKVFNINSSVRKNSAGQNITYFTIHVNDDGSLKCLDVGSNTKTTLSTCNNSYINQLFELKYIDSENTLASLLNGNNRGSINNLSNSFPYYVCISAADPKLALQYDGGHNDIKVMPLGAYINQQWDVDYNGIEEEPGEIQEIITNNIPGSSNIRINLNLSSLLEKGLTDLFQNEVSCPAPNISNFTSQVSTDKLSSSARPITIPTTKAPTPKK